MEAGSPKVDHGKVPGFPGGPGTEKLLHPNDPDVPNAIPKGLVAKQIHVPLYLREFVYCV